MNKLELWKVLTRELMSMRDDDNSVICAKCGGERFEIKGEDMRAMTKFSDIDVGQRFRHNGGEYMRTETLTTEDDDVINVVCLGISAQPALISVGSLLLFHGDEEVEASDEI